MAKPPPAGPSSDIEGVNRDARVGVPNRDSAGPNAEDKQAAEADSKARPSQTEEKPGGA
ncbi:hypothetical protein [Sphingomonas morindae]|uniref:Uncharacterized protein n=1 Tax=Sphingomonas morindae TaxID=1541170 RepID=A0ABY4X3H3_9SPHN|nr:hypothetical protein [Sphingomonas morindae]USI71434.1 hypothetical protein LHA26_08760 [Sphingomonas morindae]